MICELLRCVKRIRSLTVHTSSLDFARSTRTRPRRKSQLMAAVSKLYPCLIGVAALSHSRVGDGIHSPVCNTTRLCGLFQAERHAVANKSCSR